jgi:hypothetical protein
VAMNKSLTQLTNPFPNFYIVFIYYAFHPIFSTVIKIVEKKDVPTDATAFDC